MAKVFVAEPDDVDNIYDINKDSLPVYYTKLEHLDYIMNDKNIVLVIKEDDKTIGYLISQKYTDVRFHIISFAILKDYRRKGYGKVLLDFLKEKINKDDPKISNLTLYVMQENQPAYKFYKNTGFIRKKVMMNYYGPRRHGYFMVRKI